jgi:HemX protein
VIDRTIVFLPSLFYACAALAAVIDLIRARTAARVAAVVLLGLALATRVATFLEPGLCPVDLAGGGLGIIALVLALAVLVSAFVERKSAAKTLVLITITAVLDLLGQLVADRTAEFTPPPHERALGELHGGIVLLAYAAFVIGAVYALLYLLQYWTMKQRRLGFWFERLPPLQQLESRATSAEYVGLALLSVGLGLGFYSYFVFRGGVPWSDVKFVVAMLLWGWAATGWYLRRVRGWHGIRVMWIPAFGLVVLAGVYSVGGAHPFWSNAP